MQCNCRLSLPSNVPSLSLPFSLRFPPVPSLPLPLLLALPSCSFSLASSFPCASLHFFRVSLQTSWTSHCEDSNASKHTTRASDQNGVKQPKGAKFWRKMKKSGEESDVQSADGEGARVSVVAAAAAAGGGADGVSGAEPTRVCELSVVGVSTADGGGGGGGDG